MSLVVAELLPASMLTLQAAGVTKQESRPNILLIITDDQGYGDLSIHGNPYLQTPNIDKLAKDGVQFERYYVSTFSAPTRAALLTGRWPERTGCHGVTHNAEAMRPSELTIAEALRAGGYRSECIGKWHNGEQYPYTPQGQGFDEAFGFNAGHINQYFNPVLLRGNVYEQTKGYVTDVLTDEAMKFITNNKSKPFFCYLSYNAPHSPYQVPDKYFDKFKAKGLENQLAAFYGMCENLDDNIGRLLKHLDAEHLSDNTIVLFMTDNGGTSGVSTYNAGMRGGKTSVHEGGSRVPLFVRWPAAKWQPHTVKQLTAHIDIMPTLLDLCKVKKPAGPKVDGVSLRPLLEKKEVVNWSERVFFIHNPIDETNKYPGAVRTERYRLTRDIKGPQGGSSAKGNDASATAWQLYDMDSDPAEKKDISAKKPEIVKQLSERYYKWYADISSQGLQRFPLPIGYAMQNPVELEAPQAYFDEPLKFACGSGASHDWLTGWTDTKGKVWFDIEAVTAGEYEIELAFGCSTGDAGSRVRISVGNKSVETIIPAAEAPEITLAHRDEKYSSKCRMREWSNLKAGKLTIPKGRSTITIEALSKHGSQVLDLKHLKLNLLPISKPS